MDEQQMVRYIPKNVLQTGKLFTFKKRNLVEGVIWALLFAFIINLIPFVFKVKLIIIVCVGLVLIVVNGFGIRGNAFSSTLYAYLQYKYYTNNFHYRRMNSERENPTDIIESNGKVRTIKDNITLTAAKKFIGK